MVQTHESDPHGHPALQVAIDRIDQAKRILDRGTRIEGDHEDTRTATLSTEAELQTTVDIGIGANARDVGQERNEK